MFYSDNQYPNLNCVGITGLSKDFQEGWIRHKEEPWEEEPLFLKVPVELGHIISSVHITMSFRTIFSFWSKAFVRHKE